MVWSDACLLHDPKGEVWVGVTDRGHRSRRACRGDRGSAAGGGSAGLTGVARHDDTVLDAVHDRGLGRLAAHLLGRVAARQLLGPIPGRSAWCRTCSPPQPCSAACRCARRPRCTDGRGSSRYDTMTLVGPGTWEAARGAVDAALTAVDLVASSATTTSPTPCAARPGHHVTVERLRRVVLPEQRRRRRPGLRGKGHERVAIVDIDAHHGNGTQVIFYDRADVFYGSVHVDPAAGLVPALRRPRRRDRTRRRLRANRNIPLAEGTPDDPWLDGVAALVDDVQAHGATALVVSLGVDAAIDDPESPLQITDRRLPRRR